MKQADLPTVRIRALGIYFVLLCCALRANASGDSIIQISNLPDGWGSLIQTSDRNFYGVSGGGTGVCQGVFGTLGCGAVEKATPSGAISVIVSFPPGPDSSNSFPFPNSLIQGTDGNFYGTTARGGLPGCANGCGTVFKLTPAGTLTTLHSFNSTDGSNPLGLVEGNDGNFYGFAEYGGATCQFGLDGGCGTIFMITPQGAFTSLYSFDSKHGVNPSSLTKGADGSFYGTASSGGNVSACPSQLSGVVPSGCGTAFKITPTGTLTTLYTFDGTSGGEFPGGLFQATDGSLYGYAGNLAANTGFVFKLAPDGTFSTVSSFDSTDGSVPSSLVQGTDGNLYGTTSGNGGVLIVGVGVQTPAISGTLFRIALPAGTLTTLYSFCDLGCPPPETAAGSHLLQGNDGNLYGLYDSATAGGLFEYPLVPVNLPAIQASNGIQNGASFQAGIPSNGWMTLKGTNLSAKSDTWNNSIVDGALPTQLDGVKVTVGGQAAYIQYVSSNQINAIAPNLAAGPAQVIVTTSNGTSQAVSAQVSAVQPAFFQWGNYAVATRQDFSYAVKNGTFAGTTTIAAKPGDVIILWGTGFGPTTPAPPAGMETPATSTFNTTNKVSVTVGATQATVFGAALAPGYAALYQVAIQLPSSLTDGDYPIVAAVNGVQSPSTVLITVSSAP